MAYIRTKTRGDHHYAYIVHGFREGETVRQKTLLYLGRLSRCVLRDPLFYLLKHDHPDIDFDEEKLRASLIKKQKDLCGWSEHASAMRDEKEADRLNELFAEAKRKTLSTARQEIDAVTVLEIIEAGYRKLAREWHPDAGGDSEDMVRLNTAKAHLETLFAKER